MKKKYIIFDFDGTLANTNNIVIDSWQATFRHYLGHELPVRDIEATFGEILVTTMARLVPNVDVNEAVDYFRDYQSEHQDEGSIVIFDGIWELLTELRKRGYLIGVGTSRTENTFRDYMKMLGMFDMVDEIVTMNDVTRHKPDPETAEAVLLKLAEHDAEKWADSGDAPCVNSGGDIYIPDAVRADAIFIGDTKYDIGCAQNAGIDSVLVEWSHYVDEEEMAALGFEPTYKIKTPADLLELI